MSTDATATPFVTEPQERKGAGVGRRFLATIVDGIVFVLLGALFFKIWGETGTCDSPFKLTFNSGSETQSVCGAPAAMYGLLLFGYYIVLEKLLGATIGKLVLGLRVTMLDGSAPTWGAAVIRTLLRVVDAFLFYLVAAIAVWVSKRNQRLGDMAAGTVVAGK